VKIKKLANTELVKLCAKEPKNESAWSEFYSRFDESIWLVVQRESSARISSKYLSKHNETVKDLVQDVYYRILANDCKALKNFRGNHENAIYLYLGIIARNIVRNYAIINPGRPGISEEEMQTIPIPGSSEDELQREMLEKEIESILDNFIIGKNKERDKLICKLYFYERFTPKEIAACIRGIEPKTVNNIITPIKKELQQRL